MSLKSQQKAVPSCLYKNVCFTKRNPGLLRGGFHNKMVSILSFFFYFFSQRRKSFLLLSRRQDWSMVSASYMLCFACTGGNALLQASVYFIPNRSHCCTEGIFFLFRVIILRETLMYKYAWNGTKTRPAGTVVLSIWKYGY